MNVLLSFRVSSSFNKDLTGNYLAKSHADLCPDGYNFADHLRYLLWKGMQSSKY